MRRAPGAEDREVEPRAEPLIYREEVAATLFTLSDINLNVAKIVRLLEEDDNGEEETPEDTA